MSEQENTIPPDDEELVAWLDGELDDDRARAVEELLARDPVSRSRVHDLERTWDALDRLPQGEPTDVFTRSTIEMVLGDVRREKNRGRLVMIRRVSAAAVLLVVPAILGLAAFWTIRQRQLRPMEELVRDLPVIQNVDIYTKIPDIGFLEKLKAQGAFSVEPIDDDDPEPFENPAIQSAEGSGRSPQNRFRNPETGRVTTGFRGSAADEN